MTISTSHPSALKLEIPDLNILINLLEVQPNLHFQPLASVDHLQVSESSKLNQLLLKAKQASREAVAFGGSRSEQVELNSTEIALIAKLINACMELREYLGLKNDTLVQFKKRLGVDRFD